MCIVSALDTGRQIAVIGACRRCQYPLTDCEKRYAECRRRRNTCRECARLPLLRGSEMPKRRKVGRPAFPKGQAKGWIVPVRFSTDDLKALESSARAKGKTVSEWIRTALQIGAKETYRNYLIEVAARPSEAGYLAYGWITNQNGGKPIPFEAPGMYLTKEAALEFGVSWCREKING